MNVEELKMWLDCIPPKVEVYVQTTAPALEQVKAFRNDKDMGCVVLLTKIDKR